MSYVLPTFLCSDRPPEGLDAVNKCLFSLRLHLSCEEFMPHVDLDRAIPVEYATS